MPSFPQTIRLVLLSLALWVAATLYGTDDTVVRLGAAWLLWGYGISLAIALVMARRAA